MLGVFRDFAPSNFIRLSSYMTHPPLVRVQTFFYIPDDCNSLRMMFSTSSPTYACFGQLFRRNPAMVNGTSRIACKRLRQQRFNHKPGSGPR